MISSTRLWGFGFWDYAHARRSRSGVWQAFMEWNIIESKSGIHYPGINLQFLIRDNSSLYAQKSLCLVMVHVFVQGYTAQYNSIPLIPFPSRVSTSCPRCSACVFYHQSICRSARQQVMQLTAKTLQACVQPYLP